MGVDRSKSSGFGLQATSLSIHPWWPSEAHVAAWAASFGGCTLLNRSGDDSLCNNKVWERKYIFLQPDDDRGFRVFAGRTGHNPKWDAVVVGRVRSGAGMLVWA